MSDKIRPTFLSRVLRPSRSSPEELRSQAPQQERLLPPGFPPPRTSSLPPRSSSLPPRFPPPRTSSLPSDITALAERSGLDAQNRRAERAPRISLAELTGRGRTLASGNRSPLDSQAGPSSLGHAGSDTGSPTIGRPQPAFAGPGQHAASSAQLYIDVPSSPPKPGVAGTIQKAFGNLSSQLKRAMFKESADVTPTLPVQGPSVARDAAELKRVGTEIKAMFDEAKSNLGLMDDRSMDEIKTWLTHPDQHRQTLKEATRVSGRLRRIMTSLKMGQPLLIERRIGALTSQEREALETLRDFVSDDSVKSELLAIGNERYYETPHTAAEIDQTMTLMKTARALLGALVDASVRYDQEDSGQASGS
jgi:hypothetical protein